ncbi:MAG: glycosyl hydrolase, partial [Polaribacter sp.]
MKKITTLLFCVFTAGIFAQVIQRNAPWIAETPLKEKQTITLEEAKNAAMLYFTTIDKNKKGSGLKPFERWNYHWSHYTKADGTIAPASDLWSAWEAKNAMNNNQEARTDESNWISLGPYSHTNTGSWSPGQGRVNAIAVDPSDGDTYYVGAPAGGIWKSTDAGINWTPLTDYLPQIGVSGIAVHPTDPQTIYIATGDDDAGDSYAVGVFKSTDGGATWNNTGSLTGNPNSMNDIYIHPTDTETVLVATSSGVHKTTNGGTSWTRKLSGNIRDLKMRPNDPTIWYAASNNTFYKSSDSGESFQNIQIPALFNSQRIVMDVTPKNPDYVYFVSAGSQSAFNGVWKSTNSGDSFTQTAETDDIFESSQAWFDLALTISDKDENKVYVGVLNIWSSTDGGDNFTKLNNWSSPNTDSYTHADIHIMRFINGKFFAGTDGGIYVSTNHGTNFTD